jgi:uncharacterized protein YcbX
MPILERIFIYPIKSLDGLELSSATVVYGGALQYDREFALVDAEHRFVNAKRFPAIHHIRATFELEHEVVTLSAPRVGTHRFHLRHEPVRLQEYFSDYFGFRVFLAHNAQHGFPDDQDAPGATVVAHASLQQVAQWFADLSTEEVMRRFRVNLILGEADAFWEDRLYGADGESVQFQIGSAIYEGVKPCARCVVPTRNSLSGDVYRSFQKIFSERRRQTLPMWAEPSRFSHFYRLGVNTRAAASEVGKVLRLGDAVKILS